MAALVVATKWFKVEIFILTAEGLFLQIVGYR